MLVVQSIGTTSTLRLYKSNAVYMKIKLLMFFDDIKSSTMSSYECIKSKHAFLALCCHISSTGLCKKECSVAYVHQLSLEVNFFLS